MYKSLLILLTFLSLIACSEEKEQADTPSFRDLAVMKIDSIEDGIKASIDSARNPGIKTALTVIKEYEIFAYKYPQDSLTPVYMFKSAQIFDGMLGDKAKAAEIYQRIYDNYPDYEKRPMMLFYQGNAYHDLGDTTTAISRLQSFIINYPEHDFADDAKNLIAYIRMDENEMKKFFKSTK